MKKLILYKVYLIITVLEIEQVKMDLHEVFQSEDRFKIYPILTSAYLKLENLNELNLCCLFFA